MEERLRETAVTPEENTELQRANNVETAARNMLTNVPTKDNREWYVEAYAEFNTVWDKLLTKYYPDINRDLYKSNADFNDLKIWLTLA